MVNGDNVNGDNERRAEDAAADRRGWIGGEWRPTTFALTELLMLKTSLEESK